MTFGRESDQATAATIFARCRKAGINFLDTADVYSGGRAEEIVGDLLQDCRDEWIISTKFQAGTSDLPNDRGASRRYILKAVERSLRRLKTDRIEFYFLHNFDPHTDMEETVTAFDDLVRQGKILYPAVSNFAAWQVMKGLGIADRRNLARFECVQPMYSLVKRQAEVEFFPMAQSERLGVTTYSPIAAGLLTGKYAASQPPSQGRIIDNKFYAARYDSADYLNIVEKFTNLCAGRGWSPVTVAVAWAASHPAVTSAIIGARNISQLEPSLDALDFDMTSDLRDEITALAPTPALPTDRLDEQRGLFIH